MRENYAVCTLKTEDNKPSLHCFVEEILELLRDSNVRRIGLWEMAIIKKTTVMQNLNKNENVAKCLILSYGSVHVSKKWNLEKLQRVIIDQLKLNMECIINLDEIS